MAHRDRFVRTRRPFAPSPGRLFATAGAATILGHTIAASAVAPEQRSTRLQDSAFRQAQGRCDACHAVDPEGSHPIGVTPSMAVPPGLPLNSGQITCLTCHEPTADAHSAARAGNGAALRAGANPVTLCTACHGGSLTTAASAHALAMARAHPNRPTGGPTALRSGAHRGVDAESATCMACHDGSIAADAGHMTGLFSGPEAPQDHPIGVTMRHGRSHESLLANPAGLDERIQLFNGAVGCGSCHNLYSPIEDRLVMSNHGSQLCLSCHLY
ncbi:MAG: hypothetical protein KDA20_06620 [Phycisphaerales bacterium]|nr:hypothetical protein [Phycisphaerales bacterium]